MRCNSLLTVALLVMGASILSSGDNRWTCIGPYGGDIGKFAFHPSLHNLVFASGDTGLFRSADGGRKWERVHDSWVVGDGTEPNVRIHPADGARVFLADDRLYVSSDRGTTWQLISREPFPERASDFEMDPSDPSVLYILTRLHGVYRSTDGGVTWAPRNSGLDIPAGRFAARPQLEINPTGGNTLYVLLPDHKIFKTTTGGAHWKRMDKGIDPSSDGRALMIDPSNTDFLYTAGEAGVFKTTDAGMNWAKVHDAATWGLATDHGRPNSVYAVRLSELLKTVDGGATWTSIDLDLSHATVAGVHPSKDNLILVGEKLGITRSTDTGKSWHAVNAGIDNYLATRMAYTESPVKRLFCVASAALYESQDGGRNWALSSLSEEGRLVIDLQVHAANPRLIFAGLGVTTEILALSRDGGSTWEFGAPIRKTGWCHGVAIALDPREESIVYMAVWEDRENAPRIGRGVAKSTDQGQTWRFMNAGLSERYVTALAVDPRRASVLLAGTGDLHGQGVATGQIFKTTNGGATWKKSSTGLAEDEVLVSAITFDPDDSTVVYTATGSGVYKSSDGGRTWALKTGPLGCAFVQPLPAMPKTLMAGRSGSLLISIDQGESWTAFDSTGLGPFGMNDFMLDPLDSSRYLIGTNRGVFSYTRKGAIGGPVIQQLSPDAGRVGDSVTINGSGYGQLQLDSKVRFGSIDAGVAQSWSDESIRVTVPSGARTGAVAVTVLGKKSNAFGFIVMPATGNIEPTGGPASGGTRVTILAPSGTSGTQFNVLFGSTLARNIGFVQPNVITCESPPGSGTVEVKVTSSVTSTTVGQFTYY
ncbi:MAG: IPT/TIG domain-containing protein [Acidobacteriota bacterium]